MLLLFYKSHAWISRILCVSYAQLHDLSLSLSFAKSQKKIATAIAEYKHPRPAFMLAGVSA